MNSRRWITLILGILLVAGHFAFIASTWKGVGYVKDAGYYFGAARDNFGWYMNLVENISDGKPLESFSERNITRYWDNNHQHPPLCKVLMGLNHQLWNKWIPLLNYSNSHDVAALLWMSLMLALMFAFTVEIAGRATAVFAVLVITLMPRLFFHTHINTFDVPAMSVWFLTIWFFRRGMLSARWSWLTGIMLGIALATRNSSWFLPLVFFLLYFYSPYGLRFIHAAWNLPHAIKKVALWKLAAGLAVFVAPLIVFFVQRELFNPTLFASVLIINIFIAYQWLRRDSRVPGFLAPIIPAMFTAPFTFFLLWPWLWHNTWPRLNEFFMRHLDPPAWETYYLGEIVVNPPPFEWHYPFVMSWYTIPAVFLVMGLAGAALLLWRGRVGEKIHSRHVVEIETPLMREDTPERPAWSPYGEPGVVTRHFDQFLLLVNIAIPVLMIANPQTPIYGGTKHYMAALPYFSICAALAFRYVLNYLSATISCRFKYAAVSLLLGVALLSPGAIGIWKTHPHCLAYYNEFMDGAVASPEVGMQRTFWAEATAGVLDYLNKNVPENGSVWYNDTPWDSTNAYRIDGLLRQDIRRARSTEEADYAVMEFWKYYIDGVYKIRQEFDAAYPVTATRLDGMPLVEVYRNNRKLDRTRHKDRKPPRHNKGREPLKIRDNK